MASTTRQFNAMTISQLKEELRRRHLKVTAPRKSDLVARLIQYETTPSDPDPIEIMSSSINSIITPLPTPPSEPSTPGRSITVRSEAELAEAFQALAQAQPIEEFIFYPPGHTIPHQIFACLIDLLSSSPHLRRFELGGPDEDFDHNIGLELDQGVDIAHGIADLIRHSSTLEELSLRINYNDISLITKALCENLTLRRFIMIDMSDPGAFAMFLSVNTPLTHLSLLPSPRCVSEIEDLRALIRALPFNSHLLESNLGRWFIDDEDLHQSNLSWIPPILTQNHTLTHLHLGDDFDNFGPESVDDDTDDVALHQAIVSIREILARNRGEPSMALPATFMSSLEGQVIVLSGFRSAELMARIQARGGQVGTTISSRTTMLVLQKPETRSAKVLAAEQRGITVIARNTFEAQYF